MPEFHLDTAGGEPNWTELEPAVQGFIEAMFFCETCPGTDRAEWDDPDVQERLTEGQLDGTIPTDVGYAELDPESLLELRVFVLGWLGLNAGPVAEALARDGYDATRMGNDLYYTRAGHGTGFWDRSELDADDLGERLSSVTRYGEVNTDWNGTAVTVDIY